MRRIFRRSILWLIPALILPLGAAFVLQYNFLRTLEQKTASAERNWLRNSLERVTWEIESTYRTTATRALTMPEYALRDTKAIGEHFREHPVPGARTFFAVSFKSQMVGLGYFDPAGRAKVPLSGEAEAVKFSIASWHMAHKWNRMVPQPALNIDERDPQHRVILRPVTDATDHVVGVVGVILDPQLSTVAMTRLGVAALKPNTAVALRIADRFPKMAGNRNYVTQPLSFVFTDWRAGVRGTCASPEQIAADQFRINMIWTGSVMVVLFAAILLGIQAVLRQSRLSQMKSDFVSNVSHELRTPLASIRVFGEYMRLGRVTRDDKIQQYGEYIEAESRRLTQLINNILDFSKIESEEKKYHFCETDVVDLVGGTVAAVEMPLRDKGFVISFEADATHPAPLQIDRDAIGQVIVNLLDNAVKYSGDSRQIDVRVEQSGGNVRISVRDHGIGIPGNEQKKIFEKFYRVGSGLVHDVKGSGLGLAIVQHVVKAHGGRVEVASVPGEGSTFTIVLPVADRTRIEVPATEFA